MRTHQGLIEVTHAMLAFVLWLAHDMKRRQRFKNAPLEKYLPPIVSGAGDRCSNLLYTTASVRVCRFRYVQFTVKL